MKKALIALSFLLVPALAFAQYDGGYTERPTLTVRSTDPSGACTGAKFWINSTTGDAFACYGGAWNTFGGGGSPTFPLLAATGCVAPPYGFTADSDAGVCLAAPNFVRVQTANSGNSRSMMQVASTGYTFQGFDSSGASQSYISSFASGSHIWSANNVTRLELNRTGFKNIGSTPWEDGVLNSGNFYANIVDGFLFSISNTGSASGTISIDETDYNASTTDGAQTIGQVWGVVYEAGSFYGYNSSTGRGTGFTLNNENTANQGAVVYAYKNNALGPSGSLTSTPEGIITDVVNQTGTNIDFDLKGDVTSDTFLRFTNVATPAKQITFTQDSSVPRVTIASADGTVTTWVRLDSTSALLMFDNSIYNAVEVKAGQIDFSAGAAQRFQIINGGAKLVDNGSKPTCNATNRGVLNTVNGGAGVKDTVEVCAKDAADVYDWRTIY